MLEAERDVVDGVEKDEPLIARHLGRERVGLQAKRLGGELATAIARDGLIDVAVAHAAHVHHERARGRQRHEMRKGLPELPFVFDHVIAKQLRVRKTQHFGRALQVHLAHPSP